MSIFSSRRKRLSGLVDLSFEDLTVSMVLGMFQHFLYFPSDAFSWEDYLKETSSIPAPPSCFRQVRCLVWIVKLINVH